MSRIRIVKLIAAVFVVKGLWDLSNFISPMLSLSLPTTVKLLNLFIAAVEIITGTTLFRRAEFGRLFALTLLVLGGILNFAAIFWVILVSPSDYAYTVSFFDQPLTQSNTAFWVAMLLVTVLLEWGAAAFLNQRNTIALFQTRTVSSREEASRVE